MKPDVMKPGRDKDRSAAAPGAALNVARAISLGLAAVVVAFVFIHPVSLIPDERLLARAVMPMMLLGARAGVAYGLGFRPRGPVLATVVGPYVSWPLMMSALAFAALAPAG